MLTALLCIILMLTPDTNGSPSAAQPKAVRAYCGLYCVYGSARLLASDDVPFEALVKPEYLTSQEGSNFAQLLRAIEDVGLEGKAVRGLTVSSLYSWEGNDLAILQVKSSPVAPKYDHFVLLVGVDHGEALIIDGPQPMRSVPIRELVVYWSGAAILVARPGELNALSWFAPMYRKAAIAGCILLVVIVVYRQSAKRPSLLPWGIRLPHRSAALQAAVIVAIGGAMGVAAGLSSDAALLRNKEAADIVYRMHYGGFVPRISGEEATVLHRDGAIFVDARIVEDYVVGHIEGAKSIPAGSSKPQRASALRDVPTNASIVVYCKNPECLFAETVAAALLFDGFSNVVVYPGGWEEWQGIS